MCIVAPVHRWDDVRVFRKEARTLADAGYEVTLISRIESPRIIDGVRVVPSVGSSGYRLLRFILLPVVGVQALMQNAGIYHLHNPDTLLVAVLLRMFGKKVIYDTHEDFTRRILVRDWIPGMLRRPLAYLVARAESLISRLATASIATQQDVIERLNGTTLLLGNPPRANDELLGRVQQSAQALDVPECQVRAIYIGRLNRARGLYDMVDAMEIANRSAQVRLWLIGPADGNDLDGVTGRPGWDYVDYMPAQAQETAFAYVVRADVGLVVFRDVGGYAGVDPNKLYEYMMLGKPFIASAFENWRNRFEDFDAGWFVEPGSVADIARTLVEVADNKALAVRKGANGRDFVRSYNWETESRKLLNLYTRV